MKTGTRSARRAGQGGFISVEIVAGLFVLGAVLLVAGRYGGVISSYRTDRAVASDAQVVANAATNWLADNNAQAIASSSPTGIFPLSTFQSFLPSSFNAAGTNGYGQTYSLRVFQSSPGQLDAQVVTVGGNAIPENDLHRVTNLIGGAGGFISNVNPATAQGAYGAWSTNFANYGGTPGGGHVAIALFVQNASTTNGALDRVAVAGHPEFNQMSSGVSIDMNGNNLNNALHVFASSVAASTVSASSVQAGEVLAQQVVASSVDVPDGPSGFSGIQLGEGTLSMDDNNGILATATAGGLEVLNQAGTAFEPFAAGNTNINGSLTAQGIITVQDVQMTDTGLSGEELRLSQQLGGTFDSFDGGGDLAICPAGSLMIGVTGFFQTFTAAEAICQSYNF